MRLVRGPERGHRFAFQWERAFPEPSRGIAQEKEENKDKRVTL